MLKKKKKKKKTEDVGSALLVTLPSRKVDVKLVAIEMQMTSEASRISRR